MWPLFTPQQLEARRKVRELDEKLRREGKLPELSLSRTLKRVFRGLGRGIRAIRRAG